MLESSSNDNAQTSINILEPSHNCTKLSRS